MEIWKDIDGYSGIYKVSNHGRIKSLHKKKEIILKQRPQNSGYLIVHLYKNGQRKALTVHRLVAEHFIPNPDNKKQVNHINGIKTDNHDLNLEWCTKSENICHSYKSGITKRTSEWNKKIGDAQRGSKSNNNTLTESQIPKIRDLRSKGYSYNKIADIYGVSRQTIGYIIRGETWTHV